MILMYLSSFQLNTFWFNIVHQGALTYLFFSRGSEYHPIFLECFVRKNKKATLLWHYKSHGNARDKEHSLFRYIPTPFTNEENKRRLYKIIFQSFSKRE